MICPNNDKSAYLSLISSNMTEEKVKYFCIFLIRKNSWTNICTLYCEHIYQNTVCKVTGIFLLPSLLSFINQMYSEHK